MKYLSVSLALGLAALSSIAWSQDSGFKIVVNAKNAVSEIGRDEVSQYFLKKRAKWAAGEAASPIDQKADSLVRAAFSKAVLGKDVSMINAYWQTQIFSGRSIPPPERSSDAAVLAYVEANPGAIGYVSANAAAGKGVKTIKVN